MGSREDDMYWNARYEGCDCEQCDGCYPLEWCEKCGCYTLDEDGNCEECDG